MRRVGCSVTASWTSRPGRRRRHPSQSPCFPHAVRSGASIHQTPPWPRARFRGRPLGRLRTIFQARCRHGSRASPGPRRRCTDVARPSSGTRCARCRKAHRLDRTIPYTRGSLVFLRIQISRAAIAKAKESSRPPLQMVLGQFSPLRRTFQSLRQNRVFLVDQIRPRIPAADANKPIEKKLEVRGEPVPIDRPDERPGVSARKAGVEVQVPKKVGLMIATRPVTIAGPDAQRQPRSCRHRE